MAETILLLQDTTTFGYHRDNPQAVGAASACRQACLLAG